MILVSFASPLLVTAKALDYPTAHQALILRLFQIRSRKKRFHMLFVVASIRGVLIAGMLAGVSSSVEGSLVLPCPIPPDPAIGRRGGLGT